MVGTRMAEAQIARLCEILKGKKVLQYTGRVVFYDDELDSEVEIAFTGDGSIRLVSVRTEPKGSEFKAFVEKVAQKYGVHRRQVWVHKATREYLERAKYLIEARGYLPAF